MVPIICAVIGLAVGWVRKARKSDVMLDKVQYAVGHGFAFGLIGLIASVIYLRVAM